MTLVPPTKFEVFRLMFGQIDTYNLVISMLSGSQATICLLMPREKKKQFLRFVLFWEQEWFSFLKDTLLSIVIISPETDSSLNSINYHEVLLLLKREQPINLISLLFNKWIIFMKIFEQKLKEFFALIDSSRVCCSIYVQLFQRNIWTSALPRSFFFWFQIDHPTLAVRKRKQWSLILYSWMKFHNNFKRQKNSKFENVQRIHWKRFFS